MRILVFGGRDFGHRRLGAGGAPKPDWLTVYEQHCAMQATSRISAAASKANCYSHITIISGRARGADTVGVRWAEHYGYAVDAYPADWDRYGKRAGFLRNRQMLQEGKPDLGIEFPGGRGTADMHSQLQRAGVPVYVVPYTAPSGRVSIWPRSTLWRRPRPEILTPNSQS